MILAIIPLLCFVSLFLVLGNIQSEKDWRRIFLRSSIIWGTFAILSLELLSIFDSISPFFLSLIWLAPTSGLSLILYRINRESTRVKLPSIKIPDSRVDRILLFAVGLTLLITLIIAWLAPPQTADSLVYHMSRVAHWAQNQSIKPFATGIRFQNTMSQAAELINLHFYVLAGSDKMANLVQWFAMAGSLIGVSLVASQLGARRAGRIFAVAFAASIPMGIVQASSNMTDYVVAFWMICVTSEGLSLIKGNTHWISATYLGLSVGLAIATKPTSFAFLLPFALFIPIILIRQVPLKRFFLISTLILFCVFAINVFHYARNYAIYGNPIGFEGTIQRHANELINGKVILSNTIRHASLHVGTPWSDLNDWIYQQIVKVHVKAGLDINDPRTTFTEFRILKPSTNENLANNPIHAFVIFVSFIIAITFRSGYNAKTKIYGIVVISGFLVFSALFKYQIFGSRLQLPFFILVAPFTGTIFSKIKYRKRIPLIGIVLILGSMPWLFQISSRPIIPKSGEHLVGSIFSESRDILYFPAAQSLATTYKELTDRIKNRGCNNIGLFLSGSSPEYLLWVLFDAPRKDLKLEWIVSDSPTAKYEDPAFNPCAIICENCPSGWTKIRGLPLSSQLLGTQYKLFLKLDEQ